MHHNLKKTIATTGAMAFALSMVAATEVAAKSKEKKVKCYGVVAKGKNDCQTKNHSCAGMAKVDNAPDEWIMIKKSTCMKLAGASLKPKK